MEENKDLELQKKSIAAKKKLESLKDVETILIIDDGRELVTSEVAMDIIYTNYDGIILDSYADEHHYIVDVRAKNESSIVEYELVLNTKDLPQGDDEKLIDYVMDLESLIKDKVQDIKVNMIDEVGKKIINRELPAEVLKDNEFSVHKHPVGVTNEEFIVDVRLVKVLSHHKVRIKMPLQVHKTDDEGNIEEDNNNGAS